MVRRKTHEEFVEEVYNLVGDEYSVLGTYTRSRDSLLMRHNVCGNSWMIKPNNFTSGGKRCPSCSNFKTTETFKIEVEELYKGDIEVLGTYVSCTTPIMLKCKKHNREFERIPSTVLRGRRICSDCNGEYLSHSQRKPTEVFLEELEDRHEGTIVCEDEYINTHTKIRFRCLVCNISFVAEPNSVLRISGCPTCAEPKGEKAIREYLERNNINFTSQKKFPDCRNVRPLPFDFYIPEYTILIEYHGKQHYEPIEFFGGVEAYIEQVNRDSIKEQYAKDKGIKLVIISYTVTGRGIDSVLDSYFRSGKPSSNLK